MAEQIIRTGTSPVQSEVLVNVDGTTITGDGSPESPLKAASSSLLPVLPAVRPALGGTVSATAGKTAIFDMTNQVNGSTVSVDFPAASSVPNGTTLQFVTINGPSSPQSMKLTLVPHGSDTFDAGAGGNIAAQTGVVAGTSYTFVSDGVGSWWYIF